MAHSIFYKISKRRNRASKRAISETIATVVLIAITVAIGSAAWAWANSASANSQNNIGQAAGNDVTAISERFQILSANFSSYVTQNGKLITTGISVWIFNSGLYDTTIKSIWINLTCYGAGCTASSGGWYLPKGVLTKITVSSLNPALDKGSLQYIKSIGAYSTYFTFQTIS